MKTAVLLLCAILMFGCTELGNPSVAQTSKTDAVTVDTEGSVESATDKMKLDQKKQNQNAAKKDMGKTDKTKSEGQNMDNQIIQKNAEFMIDQIGLTNTYAVTGTAQKLERCGCGTLTEIVEIKKDRRAYIVSLRDDKGQLFLITVDEEGYLGTIRDENGEYLFTPID